MSDAFPPLPIEDAPKDGTLIILCRDELRAPGFWRDGWRLGDPEQVSAVPDQNGGEPVIEISSEGTGTAPVPFVPTGYYDMETWMARKAAQAGEE